MCDITIDFENKFLQCPYTFQTDVTNSAVHGSSASLISRKDMCYICDFRCFPKGKGL
jgi:hypothetical protein